jgi:hypothetical protein
VVHSSRCRLECVALLLRTVTSGKNPLKQQARVEVDVGVRMATTRALLSWLQCRRGGLSASRKIFRKLLIYKKITSQPCVMYVTSKRQVQLAAGVTTPGSVHPGNTRSSFRQPLPAVFDPPRPRVLIVIHSDFGGTAARIPPALLRPVDLQVPSDYFSSGLAATYSSAFEAISRSPL